MKKIFTAVVLAAAALAANAGAVSGMFVLNGFEKSPTPSGTLQTVGDPDVAAGVGAIKATFTPTGASPFDGLDFLVYCIELQAPAAGFGLSTAYTMNTAPALSTFGNAFTATQDLRLQKLFGQQFAMNGNANANATESAAMQLSIWEILNETSATLNVSNGAFKTSSTGLSAAAAKANLMLSTLDAFALNGTVDFTSFNEGGNKHGYQDFLAAKFLPGQGCGEDCNTVPEPGSLALAGLSIAGLALTRRRKAIKA